MYHDWNRSIFWLKPLAYADYSFWVLCWVWRERARECDGSPALHGCVPSQRLWPGEMELQVWRLQWVLSQVISLAGARFSGAMTRALSAKRRRSNRDSEVSGRPVVAAGRCTQEDMVAQRWQWKRLVHKFTHHGHPHRYHQDTLEWDLANWKGTTQQHTWRPH